MARHVQASRRIMALRSKRDTQGTRVDMPRLMDFIVDISPRYERPMHLSPLIERIERLHRDPCRLVVSTPPRHSKTESLLHAIVWHLKRDPTMTAAYIGYSVGFARSKSRRARMFAQAAGVKLADDAARLEEWRTTEGGGLLATGIGGPLTGHGVQLLVVDDPVKNRVEAESATFRERTDSWFQEVAFTRIEPGGSAIVCMTRWHPDDLAGRLLAQGWENVRLPALNDDGTSLWPSRWPADKLGEIRKQIGEYSWSSLYQGQPRSRGGSVFGDVHFYDSLPDGCRVAIGIDLAYSAKTHADYSVAVTLLEKDGVYYVAHVERSQVAAPDFGERLKAVYERNPGRVFGYVAGTEVGTVQLLRQLSGVPIDHKPAVGDKFVRSQPVAAAWNAGKVLMPKSAPWAAAFVEELAGFTGINDAHDDQVDALAGAFDAMAGAGDADFIPVGKRRW